MNYGIILKNLRENAEMKQIDIAKYLNITPSQYSHYEIEDRTIPIKHLNLLSNYFDVSIDYLFKFTDVLKYNNSKNNIDLEIVSKRLKEFRKENKLTQEKLAKDLNIVKGTIGNYESARALIATPFLYTICKKYNISADYLLGKIDNPKYLS